MANNIHPLIEKHIGLIESEAAKHSQFVPKQIVEAEAYHIANEAVKTFDPKSGNQFSTHLTNQLKQLSRLGTEYGNIVRVPEKQQYMLSKINKFMADYEGEHGKQPSTDMIADELHIPLKKVNFVLQGKTSHVVTSNANFDAAFTDESSKLEDWIHFVYHDMPERDKLIFEYYTGFGGKKAITEQEIATKLNIPVKTVEQRIKLIGDQIAKIPNA